MGRPAELQSQTQNTDDYSTLEVDDSPPPYEQNFGNENCNVSTEVLRNGRISMQFRGNTNHQSLPPLPPLPEYEPSVTDSHTSSSSRRSFPLVNIVIQVVGSRGDVQPFVALGQELAAVGHRVRLATHDTFKDFVLSSGLEFFPIGGDPADLMAYMVKNPGIIPKMETIRAGDIARKRKMIREMLEGCWRSCIEPDPISNIPFVAEAIIANPPSFAHVHVAQAMGIPLHLMFTMPWTATRAFPHPLANIQASNTDPSMENFLSYGLVELMTCQGLGDIVNSWRKATLNLDPVPAMFDSNIIETQKIPFTYCWSPALVPKPFDWPSHIDVCGFFFRNAPEYTPEPDLDAFLRAGPAPIYIGFGSIVMEDPAAMTQTILDAVHECGVRAIVSKGWSKLGTGVEDPNVLFLGDCPHEWLFKHVSAVIHHGGAGTTACGLLNGRPTGIVPFFGDQPFWGNMVAAAGAGPHPIDHKSLDSASLSKAIHFLLSPDALAAAESIAARMRSEDGVKAAVASFHRGLARSSMHCEVLPDHPATWMWKRGGQTVKLSHKAASVLVEEKRVDISSLVLHKSKPIYTQNQRWDPFTATTSAFVDSVLNIGSSIGNDLVKKPVSEYKRAQSDLSSASSIPDDVSISSHGSRETSTSSGTHCTNGTHHSRGAARAAGKAVGKGFGKVGNALVKGHVDVGVALADGVHALPKLYGDKVRDYGVVTDWKSGSKIGGKALAYGFYDGYKGFFWEPVKGVRDHGPLGLFTGIGKGALGLVSKPTSAMLGFVAYPALGLYRSLNTSQVKGAQGQILVAQQNYGSFLAHANPVDKDDTRRILMDFEQLAREKHHK
ncbi:glycosyltransferase family 1 protein [Halenospora varia]|nr:glycosyltransferase family 1 protein [Halenospora varia]